MWARSTSDAAEAFEQAPGGYYDAELASRLVDNLFAPCNAVDPAEAKGDPGAGGGQGLEAAALHDFGAARVPGIGDGEGAVRLVQGAEARHLLRLAHARSSSEIASL